MRGGYRIRCYYNWRYTMMDNTNLTQLNIVIKHFLKQIYFTFSDT